MWRGVIDKYREYLPVTDKTPLITLNEGNTALIECKNIRQRCRLKLTLYAKCENFNPTGSFKDRGMTVAVSKAKEDKVEAVICASTGNTAASAAAYAARAALNCILILPKGAVAIGKLMQAIMCKANIIEIDGNFDVALDMAVELSKKKPIRLVNSLNFHRIEGQKTAAFEICDALGRAPDYHCIPVGNAANITAYWRGYKQYYRLGKIINLPRLLGFQAEFAAPIVEGRPISNPMTIASAIRIGNPASWGGAVKACAESNGLITKVTDSEILSAQKLVSECEGIFIEPASAAALAGLLKLYRIGFFEEYSHVVCTFTGNGMKDPTSPIKFAKEPIKVSAKMDEVEQVLDQILKAT